MLLYATDLCWISHFLVGSKHFKKRAHVDIIVQEAIGVSPCSLGIEPMSAQIALKENSLHTPSFDGLLIGGTLVLAMTAWIVVRAAPDLFWPVLVANLWLLGYHHVVATYTRTASDFQTLKQHRFLMLGLPVIVLAAVVALTYSLGIIAIASVYLYWQWFHYLRQSEGISKAFLGKSGMGRLGSDPFLRIFLYGLPLASFLTMVDRQPETFLTMPVFTFQIPGPVLLALWLCSIGAFGLFLFRNLTTVRSGQISHQYWFYLASHCSIFIIAYAITPEINHGWLAINIWHNAQYILFVWLFNQRRFRSGVQSQGWLISYISQPGRFWLYFLTTFTATTVFYFSVDEIISVIDFSTAIPLTIVVYQTINFHHYIVDSRIWKLRKSKLQQNLGLSSKKAM